MSNKAEVLLAIERLQAAYERLQEATGRVQDDLDRDGAIQRFKFTVELLWKTLKIALRYEGIDCESPRSCIKQAFRNGLIGDDEIILDMIEDRNRSSHVYSEAAAQAIYERIEQVYLPVIGTLLAGLAQHI